MAARTTKIRHDDQTRAKIKASQLINRLTDHALGKIELTATQVRSIEILLRKILPDLSQVELNAVVNHEVADLTDGELTAIATAGSPRVAKSAASTGKSSRVH